MRAKRVRRPLFTGSYLLGCLLILGCLAGCGAQTSQVGGASGLTLHVIRTSGQATEPPLDKVVSDSTEVQRLYDAALALPLAPAGVYNCPADKGIIYRLTFLRGTTTVQTMDLNAAGCQFLSIGQAREVHQSNDAFRSLLAQTLGISSLASLALSPI